MFIHKQNGSDNYFQDVENFFNQVQDIIGINGDISMTDAEIKIAIMELIESFKGSPDDCGDIFTHYSNVIIEPRV